MQRPGEPSVLLKRLSLFAALAAIVVGGDAITKAIAEAALSRDATIVLTPFLNLHLRGWHWPTFNLADLPPRVEDVALLPVTSKKSLMAWFDEWVTNRDATLEKLRAFVDNPDLIALLGHHKLGHITIDRAREPPSPSPGGKYRPVIPLQFEGTAR